MSTNPQPAPVGYAPPELGPRPPSPLKAVLAHRGFLLAAGVLAVAAVGLNAVAEALQVHFKKQPVALRHRFDDEQAGVPKQLGNWVMVAEHSTLEPDVQESLGTKEFIFRTYVNGSAVPPDVMSLLREAQKDPSKAGGVPVLLAKVQEVDPHAVMYLNATYYTGMVDTVAHIPERCMVADGYEPKSPQSITLAAGQYADGSPRLVPAQFSTFEDQTGRGRMNRNVAYFFHCNGGYEPNPVGVRVKLQNLFERHGYYAKVELMTDEPARALASAGPVSESQKAAAAQKSQAAMADLLAAAMPELERCLPDWEQVKANAASRGGK